MIKVFNELYSDLTDTLVASFSNIKTSSVYTNTPSSYPFVSVEEINNSIYLNGMDDSHIENFVNLDYEINIYTKNPNKKTNGDKILDLVDKYFTELGFVRTTKQIMPTNDETLYRVVVQYSAVCSQDKTIYRR